MFSERSHSYGRYGMPNVVIRRTGHEGNRQIALCFDVLIYVFGTEVSQNNTS